MKSLRPKIICKNGLTMSVQASKYHYCTPKSDSGPYTSVEIGFPSIVVNEFMPYAEDSDDPTGTVYGYVPVSVVLEAIENNGGVDLEAMGVDNHFLSQPQLTT